MTDHQQVDEHGEGWWRATDGEWYPPDVSAGWLMPPRAPSKYRPLLIVAAVVAALAVAGAVYENGRPPVEVVYRVTGTAKIADITYTNGDGSTAQQSGVDVPLVRKAGGEPGIVVRVKHGRRAALIAQNATELGDIACEIDAGGKVVASNRSFGGFTLTECSATVP